MEKFDEKFDVVVIGGGPAGMQAALVAAQGSGSSCRVRSTSEWGPGFRV